MKDINFNNLIYCDLVSESDPLFKLFISQYKKQRGKGEKYNNAVRRKSETLSYVLEKTVREWIKKTNKIEEERILMYQYNNSQKRYFKEIDYVLKQKHLIIGEIKTTSNVNTMISKAAKQLVTNKEILKKKYKNIELQIIIIDINENDPDIEHTDFSSNFSNLKFKKERLREQNINIAIIKAKDIFKWGVDIGFIETPELYNRAMEENILINKKRNLQKIIKDYEKQITFIDYEMEIMTKGIVFIEEVNSNLQEEIKEYFNKIRSLKIIKKEELSKFYFNYSIETELVIVENYLDQSINISLINMESVYHKLDKKDRDKLENIYSDSKKIPIVNNEGKRKFYLSKNLNINKIHSELIRIIENIESDEFTINKRCLLLIDNNKMVFKFKNS